MDKGNLFTGYPQSRRAILAARDLFTKRQNGNAPWVQRAVRNGPPGHAVLDQDPIRQAAFNGASCRGVRCASDDGITKDNSSQTSMVTWKVREPGMPLSLAAGIQIPFFA